MELSFHREWSFQGAAGYEVALPNDVRLVYREGGRSVEFDIDQGPRRHIYVKIGPLVYWSDHSRVTLDDWVRIRHRIEKTLSLQGYTVDADNPLMPSIPR